MILQMFVEKKKEYDSKAARLLCLLKQNLQTDNDFDLRIFNKYVIDSVEAEYCEAVKQKLMCDKTVDNVFLDFLPVTSDYRQIAAKPYIEQYDEEISALKKCFKLCGIDSVRKVKCSTVFAVGKNLKESLYNEVKAEIEKAVYGKVVSDRAKHEPKQIKSRSAKVEGFIKMNDIDVYQFHRKNRIKMSNEDLCRVRDYYKRIGRDPLWIEVMSIDSCWDRQGKEMFTQLEKIDIKDSRLNLPVEIALDEYVNARNALYGDRKIPVTLNDLTNIGLFTLKSRGQATDIERLQNGNAHIQFTADIDGVFEQWIMTLNASKCTDESGFDYFGNAVTNHLSDRTCAYQAVSVDNIGVEDIKSGKTDLEAAAQSATAAKYLSHCETAAYTSNSVNGKAETMNVRFIASAAAAPKTNLSKQNQGANDAIIMLGGKILTDSLPIDDVTQRCNPQIQQKVQTLLKNSRAATVIKRCENLSHGLISAVLNIIDDGAVVDLDRITVGKVDLSLAISQPNERVIVLCDRQNAKTVISAARDIGLSAINIAVTDENQSIRLISQGAIAATLDKKLLNFKGVNQKSDAIISAPKGELFAKLSDEFMKLPIEQAFIRNLIMNNYNEISSGENPFDWTAGAGTISAPFGGKYQSTPEEATICKIPSGAKSTNTVTIMSYGSAPKITAVSPFHGAAFSIMESISKIVASGGNSLNIKLASAEHFLNPETAPIKWSEPFGALLGAFETQISMGLPNVSNCESIEPVGNFKSAFTYNSFAAATAKTNEIITAEFKSADSTVLLIPMPIIPRTCMPDFDKAKVLYRQFHYLSQSSKVISAAVVKEGGVAAAVAKMSFGNKIGVEFATTDYKTLFEEKTASIIVETKNPGAFSGMETVVIGKTVSDDCFIFNEIKIPIADAFNAFKTQSNKTYFRSLSRKVTMANIPLYKKQSEPYNGEMFLKPRVLIPDFGVSTSSNGLVSGFEAAGATVGGFAFDYKHIDESRETLASLIEKSQILVLPDSDEGAFSSNLALFSLGDKKTMISIQNMLLKGGLILGVGSGFKALIKLGLLGINPDSATLAPNISGTNQAQIVRTRVTCVKSPWLSNCEAGDIHNIALSGACTRFAADEATISLLAASGSIATQYVDLNGNPTAKQPYNPNGSICAIEGITSQNGRVFGKAALNERYTDNCYSNINGAKDQGIFKSGVTYFM